MEDAGFTGQIFARRTRSAAAATQFSTTDGHGWTRIKPSRWAFSKLRDLLPFVVREFSQK